MTAPPPPDDLPDDFTEAYRRASEADLRRPDARVSAAVLKEAARVAGQRSRSFGESGLGHWKWKAAASVAAVGLIGILSSQIYRNSLKREAPAPAVADAPAVRSAVQSNVRPSEPGRELHEESVPALSAVPRSPTRVARAAAPAPVAPMAPVAAVPSAAQSATAAAAAVATANANDHHSVSLYQSSARPQFPLTATSAQTAESPSSERIVASLRIAHPELFGASATAGTVRVAMVLNADGSLYKSVIEVPGGVGKQQMPIAEELKQLLGVGADELQSFPSEWMLAADQEHAASIVVELGVRKNSQDATRAH
jgi:hypothetical protein